MAHMTLLQKIAARVREPKTQRMLLFGLVGGVGTLINTGILWVLTSFFAVHYLLASLIATETAIVANFFGNHHLTFNDRKAESHWGTAHQFLRFQMISMTSIVGTLLILGTLTTWFGERYLLVWNLVAIAAMLGVNYTLNDRFTWNTAAPVRRAKRSVRVVKTVASIFFALLLGVSAASADIVATSQMGFHPDGNKQVVVYTVDSHATSGTFNVRDASTDAIVYSGPLAKAKDYSGVSVNCQGNLSCIVGDFTNLTVEGNYYVSVSTDSDVSRAFDIDANVYYYQSGVFEDFFDALAQQDSTFHEDQRSFAYPTFVAMADGSFIMEADQASLTLIRLGHAYRRNPALFDNGRVTEEIARYTSYLMELQGVEVQPGAGPNAVRMGSGMMATSVFVPGPTNMTTMDVHVDNGAHTVAFNDVPVVSLCGADDSTPAWDACIAHAALYYKCQVDEPCINLTYVDAVGTVTSDVSANGYAVSKGWGYEFGCYTDIPMNEEIFTVGADPCQIFYDDTARKYTVSALLGMLEGIPALHDADPAAASIVFERARNTYQYVKATGGSFGPTDSDTAYWGTALFLLYDYTGNVTYLQEAHALRNTISTTLISDTHDLSHTNGNDLYWEEYANHQSAITGAGLTYLVGSEDPADLFRDKIYNDYKDRGATLSIGRTGERVYQYDSNIQFQNSRFMLLEGLYAAKAVDTFSGTVEPFIPQVADAQLAWLTGMNAVQDGVALNSTLRSYSFIFGIGEDQPTQFHSRYLLDTGYRAASAGDIIGGRGTGYQFYNGTAYVYLDGKTNILGYELGAMGNKYHGETENPQWDLDKTFENGLDYIPGWINGAFDTNAETDVIFNYRDNLDTYEYTETTNEMVAIAIELFAYLDAQRNGLAPHPGVLFNESAFENAYLTVQTTPAGADLYLGGVPIGTSPLVEYDVEPGTYELLIQKESYEDQVWEVTLEAGFVTTVTATLTELNVTPGQLTVHTTPGATVFADATWVGDANSTGMLTTYLLPGTYEIMAGKTGYTSRVGSVTIAEGNSQEIDLNLTPINVTLQVTSNVIGAAIQLDGVATGLVTLNGTPVNVSALPDVAHEVRLTAAGYVENFVMVGPFTPESVQAVNVNLLHQNAFVNLTTTPVGATIMVDNVTQPNATPMSLILTPGSHTITATKAGYVPNVFVTPAYTHGQDVALTLTLVAVPNNITGQGADIPSPFFETETATFWVSTLLPASVNWYVNGTLIQSSAAGTNSSFNYTPSILVTSNSVPLTIRAETPAGDVTWNVNVINYLNPFFQGAPEATDPAVPNVHVISNNEKHNFTTVSVVIHLGTGSDVTLPLEPFISGIETDWQAAYNATNDTTNDITQIIATYLDDANATVTETHQVTNRGYCVNDQCGAGNTGTTTTTGGSNRPKGGGGGGGGGALPGQTSLTPEVVYVVFDKDLVPVADEAHLKLDARIEFGGKITGVEAVLLQPDGETRTLKLERTSGSDTYGTWEVAIGDLEVGKYTLTSVTLRTAGPSEKVRIRDRSFYASDGSAASEPFTLVYTTLDASSVENGTTVKITIDAADPDGLASAIATVRSSKGALFDVDLERTAGNAQYGTWTGTFVVDTPDSTFAVTSITLARADGEDREIDVADRSVYVKQVEGAGNLLTGNVAGDGSGSFLERMTKEPLLPSLVAFTLMGLVIAGVWVRERMKERA